LIPSNRNPKTNPTRPNKPTTKTKSENTGQDNSKSHSKGYGLLVVDPVLVLDIDLEIVVLPRRCFVFLLPLVEVHQYIDEWGALGWHYAMQCDVMRCAQ
jgi:hypothetical protein